MLDVYRMSNRNLLSIGTKFLFDKKYRARLLAMYHAYTNGFEAETLKEISASPELLSKSYYLVGGCELHPISLFLNGLEVKRQYYTFEHGGNPIPYFELSNRAAEFRTNSYDVFLLSQAQEFRQLVHKVQLEGLSHSRQSIVDELAAVTTRLCDCIDLIREQNSSALVLLYGYAVSYLPALGILEYKSGADHMTTRELLNRYNESLYGLAGSDKNTYVLDHSLINQQYLSADFVRPHTQDGIYDHLSQEGYSKVIRLFVKTLNLLLSSAKRVKCLVCDLDNTLWQGTLRDLGVDGITVRENAINVLRMLSRRGILLAVCSKNEPEVAEKLEAILGREFCELLAVVRVNWEPKPQNILEIAKILDIGIESVAFIDDSPFEREQVKSILPDVSVYHENQFAQLLTYDEFEPIGPLTRESANRTAMYRQQAQRRQAEQTFQGEYSQFLKSCEMKVLIALAKETETTRIAELINRTNQLNTSLKRFNAVEVGEMVRHGAFQVFRVKVADKFGDYGLVGVVIVSAKDREWHVELLTLSCRVMGRGIESFMFQFVKSEAAKCGIERIFLDFTSTQRNTAMQTIVTENGFEKVDSQSYCYTVKQIEELIIPEWLELAGSE